MVTQFRPRLATAFPILLPWHCDLEFCRTVADVARESGHYAILAPSAALPAGQALAIYPENRPDHIRIQLAAPRIELNYGPDPLLDDQDRLRRPLPA